MSDLQLIKETSLFIQKQSEPCNPGTEAIHLFACSIVLLFSNKSISMNKSNNLFPKKTHRRQLTPKKNLVYNLISVTIYLIYISIVDFIINKYKHVLICIGYISSKIGTTEYNVMLTKTVRKDDKLDKDIIQTY